MIIDFVDLIVLVVFIDLFIWVVIGGCSVEVDFGKIFVIFNLVNGCELVQVVEGDVVDVDCVVIVVCIVFEEGFWGWLVFIDWKMLIF